MASKDLRSEVDAAITLAPAGNRKANVNGSAVDLHGFESAMVVFAVGTITDGAHTPSLEDSADGSTWTAVAAPDLQGTPAALASDTPQRFGYVGSKRYIRAVVTVTGSPATGGQYAAIVLRGQPHHAPLT